MRPQIDCMLVGEALVGDGNEVAHVDLLIGPRGSPVEAAFANALTSNKEGFISLLAVVEPNLMTRPATVMYNKVRIRGAQQAEHLFGPAQQAVAMAIADSVEDGIIDAGQADDLFICVGVFVHWLAEDDSAHPRVQLPGSAARAAARSRPRTEHGRVDGAQARVRRGAGAASDPV